MSLFVLDYLHFSSTELKLPQYKYVIHVVIGEQRGEGVKVAARCLWDSDTDGHAFDNFTSVSSKTDFYYIKEPGRSWKYKKNY